MTTGHTADAVKARRILAGRFGLSDEQLNFAIGALVDGGVLDSAPVDVLNAAAQTRENDLHRQAVATAKRLGISPNAEGLIDRAECDSRLALAGMSASQRMSVKALFASSGLLVD
jgi:hypothetical protein